MDLDQVDLVLGLEYFVPCGDVLSAFNHHLTDFNIIFADPLINEAFALSSSISYFSFFVNAFCLVLLSQWRANPLNQFMGVGIIEV